MKLSTRYALYLSVINFGIVICVLSVMGWLFWHDANRLRENVQRQTTLEYRQAQEETLLQLSEYLQKNLFDALYQLDVNGVNQRMNELGLWLDIEHYIITDPSGLVITDGSVANPLFMQPHDLPLKTLARQNVVLYARSYGYQLVFSVTIAGTNAGYVDLFLTDRSLRQTLARQQRDIRKIWHDFIFSAQKVGLYALLSVLLISILLSMWLSRQLAKPLTHISRQARRLAQGDFSDLRSTAALSSSNNELVVLENAFQSMASQIKSAFELLESKVEARTLDLTMAYDEINKLNQQLQAENLRMGAELHIAQQLQRMVLPDHNELQALTAVDVVAFMQPAEEVGGDYYDVLQYGQHIKIGIGDVTGHGLASGVLMLLVQMTMRTLLHNGVVEPSRCINMLNQVIYDNLQRMHYKKNLTLLLLDYCDGHVCFSGQHEEVLVVRANGQVERIDTVQLGFIIGILRDVEEFTQQYSLQLDTGDVVVLYTDGITEALSANDELYGVERLCQVLEQHWHLPLVDVQQAVLDSVYQHIDGMTIYDDMTLLLLRQK